MAESSISLPSSFNVSTHFCTPMERSNFLCWRSQFLDILEIYDLSSHVDISASTPSSILPDSSPNPAYQRWMKHDKLVLSWIKATVSPFVQTLLLPCISASDAWQILDKRLSPLSKIHVRSLKDQLRSLTKDPDQTIVDFLLHAKSISDSLASAGSPIPESDLVNGLVDNLGSSYKEFVTSLHLCLITSFDDLYDLLIQEESLQKKNSNSSVTALAASTTSSSPGSANSCKPQHSHGKGKGRSKGKGRGQHYYPQQSPSFPSYSPAPRPPFSQSEDKRSPLLPTPASLHPYAVCQICNQHGHTARLCPQRGNYAYIADSLANSVASTHLSTTADMSWCLDSGATHHMTASPSALTKVHPYQGEDDGTYSFDWY